MPLFDDFWIITVYNSSGKPLPTYKIFSGKLKNDFVNGDFNALHQELNCSYDSENEEKLLNVIDEGTFKLLNKFITHINHLMENAKYVRSTLLR